MQLVETLTLWPDAVVNSILLSKITSKSGTTLGSLIDLLRERTFYLTIFTSNI